MLIALVGGVLACVIAGCFATSLGRTLVVRRYRHGRGLRVLLACVYAALGAALLVHGVWFHGHPHSVEPTVLVFLLVLAATIAMLLRARIRPAEVASPRRILAIGAHPDDLELACGGTLASLVDRGHEVHAVVMTRGAEGGDARTRPDEARAGAGFLGLASVEVYDLPDTQLALTSTEMIHWLETAIDRVRPHVIFTHSVNDQHQDHHAVHLATLRAARHHHSILCYESPSVTRDFNPGVFVEVADYTDVKVEAVLTHRNQAGKPYMTPGAVTGITSFRGRQAKRTHAEGFEAVRLLATEAGVF